jgi:beta-phosphoglucomutase-like phosphatase (HAD superfamily)
MLGLPDGVTACLFDLDGVLTKTATVHATAWKEMFDGFLRERANAAWADFVPFDEHGDYDRYVDGKPRDAGVRDFLASRGIELSDDEVRHLGGVKNDLVQKVIQRDGVEAWSAT